MRPRRRRQQVTTETNTGEIPIPVTIMPPDVGVVILAIFGGIWLILYYLFPSALGWFWSIFVTLLVLAWTVSADLTAIEGIDYHGFLLFNPLNKSRRVIFPGLHPKAPWESKEEGSDESLRQVVASEGPENLPTNDPAENMIAKLTIHKRMDVSGTPEEAAAKFIRFHSIDKDSLRKVVRKEVIKMFSAYYAVREMEVLLDPHAIQDAVLALPENAKTIRDMEVRWGISIGVILETSEPDKDTKDMKRTPARAEAMRTAMDKLTMEGPSKLDPEKARRAALSLDETAEFREEFTSFEVKVDAPDLKNLHDVNIIPPGTLGKRGEK